MNNSANPAVNPQFKDSPLNSGHEVATGISNDNNAMFSQNADLANMISERSQAKQFEFNAREAEKARAWQENMSNTAYQRMVADLKLAGLNPVLGVASGGASSNAGASASGGSFQGQKADVDVTRNPVMASLMTAAMNNATQKEGYNNALDIAKIQASTALESTRINSAAQMFGAEAAAAAMRYGSEQGAAASRYGSDRSYSASKYGTDKSYDSSIQLGNPLWRQLNLSTAEKGSFTQNLANWFDWRFNPPKSPKSSNGGSSW